MNQIAKEKDRLTTHSRSDIPTLTFVRKKRDDMYRFPTLGGRCLICSQRENGQTKRKADLILTTYPHPHHQIPKFISSKGVSLEAQFHFKHANPSMFCVVFSYPSVQNGGLVIEPQVPDNIQYKIPRKEKVVARFRQTLFMCVCREGLFVVLIYGCM